MNQEELSKQLQTVAENSAMAIRTIELLKLDIEGLNQRIADLAPDAAFGQLVKQDERTYSMKEAADLLEKKTGKGRNQLFDWLRAEGILLSSHTYWNQPPRDLIERGYFKTAIKQTGVGPKTLTTVTGKGLDFIIKKWEYSEEHRGILT